VPDLIKLYLDEDTINRALIRALRTRGVDLQTAQEAERSLGLLMRRLLKLIDAIPAAEMLNRLEFLSNWR
jgi:ActR/RegA family two-component response regulator